MVNPIRPERTNRARKIKNKIFAIDAAPTAIPPNPKTAARIAMMKKMIEYRNMIV